MDVVAFVDAVSLEDRPGRADQRNPLDRAGVEKLPIVDAQGQLAELRRGESVLLGDGRQDRADDRTGRRTRDAVRTVIVLHQPHDGADEADALDPAAGEHQIERPVRNAFSHASTSSIAL